MWSPPISLFAFVASAVLWGHADATTHQVSNFSGLSSAISGSSDGDVVELTANIDVTSELTIRNHIEVTSAGSDMFYLDGGGNNRIFYIESARVGVSNVKFQNGNTRWNNGGAIFIDSGSGATFGSCTFESNTASEYSGGAVYGGGTFDSCTFVSNMAVTGGGAVYGGGNFTSCTFDSNTVKGKNNHAGTGGAVYGDGTFTSCTFKSNTVIIGSGGAFHGSGTFDSCIFESNSAGNSGGAVRGDGTFTSCTFKSNTGGAFVGSGTFDSCIFESNSCDSGGGGAFVGSGTFTSCTFNSNSARNGGAIQTYVATFDSCIFRLNTASDGDGGAIDVLDFPGATMALDSCTFDSNSAGRNGDGGAIAMNSDSTATFDSCTFDSNSAGRSGDGGAIAMQSDSTATFDSCTFDSNSAGRNGDGGAIAMQSDSAAAFDTCIFNSNSAGSDGGAIAGHGNFSTCTFESNTADSTGGAVSGGGNFTSCTFESNAGRAGGAVYGDGTYDSCIFNSNTAKFYGGGAISGSGTFVSCIFESNLATVNGGAVHGNDASFTSCSFKSNTAHRNGGAVHGNDGTFTSCTFESNSAKHGDAINTNDGAVAFDTSCRSDEFASGTGKLSTGHNLYNIGEYRPFAADLLDEDNCKPCPRGLRNIGAGCDYPSSTFGINFLPCSRFWYYDPWNSTCGAFRIISIIFLCGYGILSTYIHRRLFRALRGVNTDDQAGHGWDKCKLNMLVLFAQLDLVGDTVYLSFEGFATPLLELIGMVVFLLPTAVFMISHRDVVNRHLCVFLRPILDKRLFKFEAWNEFYQLVFGIFGCIIWFIAFAWFIVPVVFVYYLVLFVFVSSKLMCVVPAAEFFLNFGVDEDKKQKMTPAMANRMFNGCIFLELTIDTIPQLTISLINAMLLQTANGLLLFQILTSLLVILNEGYPFLRGAIRYRSLRKAFEARDHKILEAQSGFVAGGKAESEQSHDVSVELGEVTLESPDKTRTQLRDFSQGQGANAALSNDIVENVRKLQGEVKNIHKEMANMQKHQASVNESIMKGIKDLHSEIEPLLVVHSD